MLVDILARFVCIVALVMSLCMGRSLRSSVYLFYLCRTIVHSLEIKPVLATWYGPFNSIGYDHPSWPLEVTGNSGFFKLVHLGTLWLSLVPILIHIVHVETLCCFHL
jgi:hypothetical protein